MSASISQGHLDLADVFFLIAFICCATAFLSRVIDVPRRSLDSLAMAAGAALIALGLFVL